MRVRNSDLRSGGCWWEEAVTEVDGLRLVWGAAEDPRPALGAAAAIPRRRARRDGGLPGRRAGLPLAAGSGVAHRSARAAWFDAAARDIGKPGLTPRGLRHNAASLAIEAGVNVKAVQRMLGHASMP